MTNYRFYYDESEHSRAISKATIKAKEFYDGFIVAITGWEEDYEPELEKRYLSFERKFLSPDSKELKSTAIASRQLRYGFATLSKANISLIEGLLGALNEQTLLYYSHVSKVEFLVRQLFGSPHNFQYLDSNPMLYSITKALVTYRPIGVFESLDKSPKEILDAIRAFLIERIELDRRNEKLKSSEIEQFSVLLNTVNTIDPPRTIKWDYSMPLKGFSAYLKERNINDYVLTIDKETATASTAKALGFHSVCEEDSKLCFGIRTADMTAGLLAKLMKAIRNDLSYPDAKSTVEKKLLNERWFRIDNRRLALYKSLRKVLKENDRSWFKTYAGAYSDDLVMLMSLIDYFNGYESAEELSSHKGTHGERFNTLACQRLCEHFGNMGWFQAPLPFQVVDSDTAEPITLPYDGKPTLLPVGPQPKTYLVLSATINPLLESPLITIKEGTQTSVYRLPVELAGWVRSLTMNGNERGPFPLLIRFQTVDGVCRADIL